MSVRFLLLVFAYVLAVVKGQLSDGEKQDILAAHNSLRANVDPTASDMEQMVCFILRSTAHCHNLDCFVNENNYYS